jgi:molecular chaperone GrpE
MDDNQDKESLEELNKLEGIEEPQTESVKPKNGSDAAQSKIAELEASVNQLKDQLLRKAAEFENYKRRVENEAIATIQFANERLLEELLPVIDDFERSLKAGKGKQDFTSLYSGIELIYQKLMKVLETQGMKSYESIGKPFDTDFHHAMMQMPKEGVPPHTVIEEVEKGYILNDKVLRHAKVIVSADSETNKAPASENSGGGSASSIGQA